MKSCFRAPHSWYRVTKNQFQATRSTTVPGKSLGCIDLDVFASPVEKPGSRTFARSIRGANRGSRAENQ
jgi:hypothetical protein